MEVRKAFNFFDFKNNTNFCLLLEEYERIEIFFFFFHF
jgi:hypothetical protein